MLRIVYKRVAGLDVHKKTVVATRMRVTEDDRVEWETETFGTTTPDLLELLDWLYEWDLTHVSMESTGDYWKPVFNVLEDTFEVWLVNAQHVKHVSGRKTDVKDSEWLAELMLHGLLKPSFIPPKPQRSHHVGARADEDCESHPEGPGRGEHQVVVGRHGHYGRLGAGNVG
jgi:transposase